jgi:two-component system chemotaxis response regulator CheB
MAALPASASPREIRVLVVDDSAFMRRAIERLLIAEARVVVVGHAVDGIEAVRLTLELRPDVITMDVDMPRMDGVSALCEIMKTLPTPTVMLSTLTHGGADTTIRALEAGAVEAVGKPTGLSYDLVDVGAELRAAVVRASHARVRRRSPLPPPVSPGPRAAADHPARHLIVIGCSTGGPPALTHIVPRLKPDLDAAVLVVQHMPAGFTAALARRLDGISRWPVNEAVDGGPILARTIVVAPGGRHLVVTADRRLGLHEGPPVHGVRPSIDVTLASAAAAFGPSLTVAILTGMGRDGAAGSAAVERAGGRVIVQDEATSVVYGMPRAAKECAPGAIEAALEGIAAAIGRHAPSRARA